MMTMTIKRSISSSASGNRLRAIRTVRGLAFWALAARTGSGATMLSAIERYDYQPTVRVRKRIAEALGVKISDIWHTEAETGERCRTRAKDDPFTLSGVSRGR